MTIDEAIKKAGWGHLLRDSLKMRLPKTASLDTPFVGGGVIAQQPLKVGSLFPVVEGFNARDASLAVLASYKKPVAETRYDMNG